MAQVKDFQRALELCQTQDEWNTVLANVVRHALAGARLFPLDTRGAPSPLEILLNKLDVPHELIDARNRLQVLVAAGFNAKAKRPAHLLQAEADAELILRFSDVRTVAEAVAWLSEVEGVSESAARRRVNRARKQAGLKLTLAAPFGRKSPTS